jgi:hypothetical protein
MMNPIPKIQCPVVKHTIAEMKHVLILVPLIQKVGGLSRLFEDSSR